MNSFSTYFSNILPSKDQLMSSIRPQDKSKTGAMMVVIAIAVATFTIIMIGYARKKMLAFRAQKHKQMAHNESIQRGVDLVKLTAERLKGKGISLTQANAINKELVSLSLTSKSYDELMKYFSACPNIEEIELNSCVITNNLLKNLPVNVTRIKLCQCQFPETDFLKQFSSKQFKELDFSFCDLKNIAFDQLPENPFMTLLFDNCKNVSLKSISVARCRVNKCENFSIHCLTGRIQFLDVSYMDNFGLDELPKNLESLSLGWCKNISWTALPDNLKKMSISSSVLQNPRLNNLPMNLESLALGHGSVSIPKGFPMKIHSFAFLPASLKRLQIANIEIPSLKDLPSGLEILEIKYIKNLFPSLDSLPKNLRSLKIRKSNLTGVFFDHLPSSLETLCLPLCTGVSLASLPSKIHDILAFKTREYLATLGKPQIL